MDCEASGAAISPPNRARRVRGRPVLGRILLVHVRHMARFGLRAWTMRPLSVIRTSVNSRQPIASVSHIVMATKSYVLDSGSPRLWRHVGRAPSPAAGPLAGLPAGGRGRPPRSRGTAPLSRCQSAYLSQAHSPLGYD